MAGFEEFRKKLSPLFDAEKGFLIGPDPDTCDSHMFSDTGSVNLLSRSCGVCNIDELGFQKCANWSIDDAYTNEKTYRCASDEMRIFGSIGSGASSVVQRVIHMPTHRVIALKRINIFEKDKQRQLLTEIQMLCEDVSHNEVLVDFHGACYSPNSGQLNIALEYVDGGSLADIVRARKCIPEPVLSALVQRILHGLNYLHGVRHLVHRDIKPANLLVNLKGEPKITDFGISIGLDNSMAMCATFVGTVTYMSPERIQNESYSYSADIWSLGLTVFECASGEFPYVANEGPVNLMLEILEDPSPSPSRDIFSFELCSFVDACLQKKPEARPSADQLLSHPFITKYEKLNVDLAAFAQSVFDPVQRMKDLADMLTIHYYSLFDGPDEHWQNALTLYNEHSTLGFSNEESVGQNEIFSTLSGIRSTLAGDWPHEKLVHVVERLYFRAHGEHGIAIRAMGSFIIGNQFVICGDGLQAEGLPKFSDLDIDLATTRMGTFQEQFIMEPGNLVGQYYISKQDLYILQN